MNFSPTDLARENIRKLQPYQVWRDAYLTDPEAIFLDNGENNFGSPAGKGYQRYPASSQDRLKTALAKYRRVNPNSVMLGNGSDELIDLLIRCFCEPGKDSVLTCEPTFGMYKIYAQINNVQVLNAPLSENSLSYDTNLMLQTVAPHTKLIFVCTPNNPTGTSASQNQLKELASNFNGLVVVDEAYIDFSDKGSALALLNDYPNLVVLQTFSKAWGLAAIRAGSVFAHPEVIALLERLRPPFPISSHSQMILLRALRRSASLPYIIKKVERQKAWLKKELLRLACVERLLESDANFFLIKTKNAENLHSYLLANKVLVSNRSGLLHCENHLRISVGTYNENKKLITLLTQYQYS